MNLMEILSEQASRHPDRPALMDRKRGGDRTLTYAQLLNRVRAGAAHLRSCGLKTGDTLVFLHPVTLELYEALLSALHAGVTAMFFDPSADKSFIETCCRMKPPRGLFASPKAHLLRLTTKPIRAIPIRFHPHGFVPGSKRFRTTGTGEAPQAVPPDHPALITFTSGSTGQPKAVVRTHQFLLDQHQALASALHFEAGQRDLVTLPVFVLANLASGLTSVLADTDLAHPGNADPLAIAAQCASTRPTRCAASPAFFQKLLTHPSALDSFSALYTGGAPVFPRLLDELQQAAPGAALYSVYGSSEAEPIAHISSQEISPRDRALMSAGHGLLTGLPVPEIQLAIIPDSDGTPLGPFKTEAFRALHLPANSPGEIVVTGKHVLQGYLDGIGDEETKIRVDDTIWHRTGDAGQLDEDGRLWLLGRASAKLPATHAHPSLYPFSAECALSECPEITRSAVLISLEKRLVVLEGHPSDLPRLQNELAWAGIDRWHVLPPGQKIPVDRRHNAKIDYPALQALVTEIE
jgi:acyl-CoA synthetase (AMP-forming)/AMP-acid ligase II